MINHRKVEKSYHSTLPPKYSFLSTRSREKKVDKDIPPLIEISTLYLRKKNI